jgi:hypothetical protein
MRLYQKNTSIGVLNPIFFLVQFGGATTVMAHLGVDHLRNVLGTLVLDRIAELVHIANSLILLLSQLKLRLSQANPPSADNFLR